MDNPSLQHNMVLVVIKTQQILNSKALKSIMNYSNWVTTMQEEIDILHQNQT